MFAAALVKVCAPTSSAREDSCQESGCQHHQEKPEFQTDCCSTTGWDLDDLKPLILIQGIDCRDWSLLQDNTNYVRRKILLMMRRAKARKLLKKVTQWCAKQAAASRLFLLENPTTSRIWQEPAMIQLTKIPGVTSTVCHAGAYGATRTDDSQGLSCKGFQNVNLWADGCFGVSWLLEQGVFIDCVTNQGILSVEDMVGLAHCVTESPPCCCGQKMRGLVVGVLDSSPWLLQLGCLVVCPVVRGGFKCPILIVNLCLTLWKQCTLWEWTADVMRGVKEQPWHDVMPDVFVLVFFPIVTLVLVLWWWSHQSHCSRSVRMV